MKNAMPAVTDNEILDGYKFHYKGHEYTAYDAPDDKGFACGYDERGRDCDLSFVWTTLGCWVFIGAELAEHEKSRPNKACYSEGDAA